MDILHKSASEKNRRPSVTLNIASIEAKRTPRVAIRILLWYHMRIRAGERVTLVFWHVRILAASETPCGSTLTAQKGTRKAMLTHKGTQTIETDRLILRRAVQEDAQPMFRNWASDPEVTKYMTWPAHGSIAVSEMVIGSWIQEYEQDSYYQWMIVLKELGQPIGSISVVRRNDPVEEAEIGYCIGSSWWHKGITTEAFSAVIGYLFTEVGMNRIVARHDPNNPHSGGVMRKCGLTYEGTSRSSSRNNQGICDAANYAILRSEWNYPKI